MASGTKNDEDNSNSMKPNVTKDDSNITGKSYSGTGAKNPSNDPNIIDLPVNPMNLIVFKPFM